MTHLPIYTLGLDSYKKEVDCSISDMAVGTINYCIVNRPNTIHFVFPISFFSGKPVHVFMFGDYELQSRMYGLSGACGKYFVQTSNSTKVISSVISYLLQTLSGGHCCLWCHVTSTDLQTPVSSENQQSSQPPTLGSISTDQQPQPPTAQKASKLRSLESLSSDHCRYLLEGRGDVKKAKLYNNVISVQFFNIPLDQVSYNSNKLHCVYNCVTLQLFTCTFIQVCLPGLHISLGVFFKLFTLFEDHVHQLDLLIKQQQSSMFSAVLAGGDKINIEYT